MVAIPTITVGMVSDGIPTSVIRCDDQRAVNTLAIGNDTVGTGTVGMIERVKVMGRDKHEMRHKNRLPPFVPLLIATLDSAAWRDMSHGAQILYVALRRRYNHNNHNNGRIYLSQRDAAEELRSHHNEIARWFRELQHYGFIVMMTPGYLGVEGRGKAPRWRLTELGYMKELPTREFTRWDGRRFQDKKTKSRAGIGARSVQGNPHTGVPENRAAEAKSVPGMAHIDKQQGVRENLHRTILPYAAVSHSPADPPGLQQQSKPRRVRPRLRKNLS
jgi:hypothetical protein